MSEQGTLPDFISPDLIKKNFIFEPRGNQSWVLEEVGKALARPEIKYVVIQAPTGSGKSPIAMAIARAVGSAYVTTANKNLQDQYARDFAQYMADLRGRSNYECCKYKGFDCASAPCRKTPAGRRECAERKGCDYHRAVEKAVNSNITSMNFSAALAFMNFHPSFEERDMVLIDEAHLIEDNLTNFIEFNVQYDDLLDLGLLMQGERIPMYASAGEYTGWITRLYEIARDIEERKTFNGNYEKFENFTRKLKAIRDELQTDADNLVMEQVSSKVPGSLYKLSFRPLDVSRYAKEKLFRFGQKTVFLSATIINYKSFIRSLGIEESECVFIDVPSTFPKENRPVHRAYVGALSMANQDRLMPTIARVVAAVMSQKHPQDKGIIHIPSYAFGDKLMALLPAHVQDRIVYPRRAADQSMALSGHETSSKPTVLMSPSMAEGVDLKDDLSRFQIITKVPYASLGDQLVKARMDRDDEWYVTKALTKLIQSYGRSVRTETDKAVTYILDENFDRAYQKIKYALPKWFREVIE